MILRKLCLNKMDLTALILAEFIQVSQILVIYDSNSLKSDPDHLQKPNFGRRLARPHASPIYAART